jgi:hypothetical protein
LSVSRARSDVEILDDGLVVFHIRLDHRLPGMRLKNKTSIRSLPIHFAVLNAGFLDGYETRTSGR